MTDKEIINKISIIFNLEKDVHPLWNANISKMSLDLISKLHDNKTKIDPELYKYLDDFDIRKGDVEYANYQLTKIEEILNSIIN